MQGPSRHKSECRLSVGHPITKTMKNPSELLWSTRNTNPNRCEMLDRNNGQTVCHRLPLQWCGHVLFWPIVQNTMTPSQPKCKKGWEMVSPVVRKVKYIRGYLIHSCYRVPINLNQIYCIPCLMSLSGKLLPKQYSLNTLA